MGNYLFRTNRKLCHIHTKADIKQTATMEIYIFEAALWDNLVHQLKKLNILVCILTSLSVLNFVTFPVRTLSTQKLLKTSVIWKCDTVLNSRIHLNSKHFPPEHLFFFLFWYKVRLFKSLKVNC